ncbi:hypothetical protein G7Y89_g2165 [Cudoniella acicularis]|uniref:BTB domain-containing protein n=1 Tax=Cudoniella acicularis TaxID=354080 RepID=A0A8H4RWT3_9HELO|nr:hypothetical protein G7Y89_g2165 [Cudoniella acicularis]
MNCIARLKVECGIIAPSQTKPPLPASAHSPSLSVNPRALPKTNTYMEDREAESQLLHESRKADVMAYTISSPTLSEATARASPSPVLPDAPSSPSRNSLSSPFNPLEALNASLISGKYSDLTVLHGEREWKAHKVVVFSQSHFLESKIYPEVRIPIEIPLPNSDLQKEPDLLNLSEFDEEAVSLTMEYLYGSQYTTIGVEPTFSLPTHVKVFILAITLGIKGLELYAAAKYKHNLNNFVTNLEVYFSSVAEIYQHTTMENPSLRFAVVEAAVMEMPNLLEEPVRSRFLEVTRDIPDFHADVLTYLVRDPNRPVEVQIPILCGECGMREENDMYDVEVECKGCGEQRRVQFF